jgi:putative hydrolase of the HAD superfamily
MFSEGKIRAILFDFYLTIVDIKTNERKDRPWRVLASFLRYRGARAGAAELREIYFQYLQESLDRSEERHPEVDVSQIFGKVLARCGVEPSPELARTVAQLFRSLTIERLRLFPESRQVLDALARRYRLALVSDSQASYIVPELRMTSLEGLFEVVVISSQHGYRKPDPRLFQRALGQMGLSKDEVVYVGDSWDRDMVGALDAGIRGVWLRRSEDQFGPPETPTVQLIPDLRGLLSLTRKGS